MTDQTNTPDTGYAELADAGWAAPLAGITSYPEDIVAQAVANGVAACEPQWIGDHGLAIVRPDGWTVDTLAVDTKLIVVVLDDHLAHPTAANHRTHRAELVLRPTAAARRWAKVLGEGQILTQEQMLDLIDDGIREIADPDGAVLLWVVSV